MANYWEVSGTTATYKNDAGTTLATIKGLKSGLTASGGSISGITVTEATSGGTGTINLTGGVLTNTNVTLSVAKGSKYQLGLVDGGYQKVTPTDVTATVNNGTITFNGKLTEGYTLKNAENVVYSKATEKEKTVTFVTLTGLNTNLGVAEGKIGTTTTTGEGDNKVTTLDEELVLLDATTGVVTLKAGALAGKDAKLTLNNTYSPYRTFALDSSVAAPELGTGSWSEVKKTASTYTANVTTAGYTLSLNSKNVTYTAEGSDVALVTVSGLKSTDDLEISSTVDAKNNATITLPTSALNQTAVKISSSKANFLLALGGDVNESDVANENIWAAKGTTYTYKTVKPEYYTYDSSTNAVSYTKQANVKTLATVKNLATGLTVDTDENTGNSVLYKDDAAVVTVDNNGVITLKADALTTKSVTLTNGTGESYKLKLDEGIAAPGIDGDTTWAVKGTTATLSGKSTAGWAETSDTLITYVAAGKTVALATVKGLKSGVAANTEKDAVGIKDSSSGEIVEGLALDENNDQKIIVSANVLGTTNVTLTPAAGYSYSLAIASSGSTAGGKVPTQAENKHFWYVKGKKLLLKDGKARYYTLSTDKQTITETDEVVGNDVATVTGLKTGLKVSDGDIDGITVSGQLITVSKDVLNKATVSVTSTSSSKTYTLALADSNLKPHNDALWKINGTTAVLLAGKTEGYTPNATNATTLTYSNATIGNELANITGLKSGLKAVDYEIDGIADEDFNFSDETAEKKITLSKNVLGTTDVTLTNKTNSSGNSYNYSLAVDNSTVTPIGVTREWRVGSGKNTGTAYFDVKTTTAGFEEVKDGDKTVQLAYKKKGTVTTTISGLSDRISESNFTNPDENGVITLSSTVLGKTNATLKNASGGTYTLALESRVTAPVANDFTWVPDPKTKTKATLQGVVESDGYELSADKLSVVYTHASEGDNKDILATVTGLKSGLTADELNDGITHKGSVLTLGDSVLGGTKLTVSGGTYTLAIGNTDSTKANKLTEWVTSGTTANYKTYNTGYYTPDAKGTTVKYTAPTKGTTYATVKGIAKNVDINGAYIAKSSASPTNGGTVTLTTDMLGTSNVTLTGSGFSLALASGVPTSAENKTEWVTSGTTATYKNYNKAYYTKSGNTIKYTKPTAGTTYATIKGIASGATIKDANISTNNASGNTVVTLNADQLAGKKVTISGSGYELALGSDVDKATLQGTYWTQAKDNASAIYKADYSAGYTAANATTITYSAKPTVTTLATVSGLAKPSEAITTRTESTDPETGATTYTYSNVFEDLFTVDDATHTITLTNDKAFGTSSGDDPKNGAKITLKDNAGQGYGLAIDGDDLKAPTAEADSLTWTLNKNKGTATYTEKYDAGVNVSDDKKTLTYAADTTKTLATISGLDTNKLKGLITEDVTAEVDDDALAENYGIQVSDTTIKLLNNKVLGTKNITLGKNDLFAFDASAVAPKAGSNKWAVSGTTAKYNKTTAAGYNATDTKVVKYVKEAVGDNIFTITGLKKGIKTDGTNVGFSVKTTVTDPTTGATSTVNSISQGITLTESLSEVNLNPDVLGTTDIQLTNGTGNYHFASEGLNAPSAPANVWTYSGGTATYKTVQDSGYTLESGDAPTKITYTAAKTTTLATVKGLSKTFTGNLDDAIVADDANETVTVNSGLLGTTNVTLTLPKNASALYSLVIGDGVAQQANTVTEWVTASTKANYKNYAQAYYTTDPTTGAIVYHKPTAGTTYATISGIKSGATIAATDFAGNKDGGTVTLSAKQLGTSNVTVSVPSSNKSAEFKLALASDVVSGTATGWVTTGIKAVFKQDYDKPTYTINEKGAIVYKAGTNKGTEIATITGANGDLDNATFEDETFSLTSDGLSTKITLATKATEGVSDYAFSFNTTYNNAAITGSANADNIAVAGDRLTITGGKGNDQITFGDTDRAGNLFIYANGDGDDTISNFMADDAIQIKSGFNKTTSYVGGNEITVGSGKITLNFYDETPDYITINNTKYSTDSEDYTSSNVLLADNNYSMDAASLSDIVNPVAASFTPYDFSSNFSLTKEDKLTPQISYSGNDK